MQMAPTTHLEDEKPKTLLGRIADFIFFKVVVPLIGFAIAYLGIYTAITNWDRLGEHLSTTWGMFVLVGIIVAGLISKYEKDL